MAFLQHVQHRDGPIDVSIVRAQEVLGDRLSEPLGKAETAQRVLVSISVNIAE